VDTTPVHDLLVARLGIDTGVIGPAFLPAVVRRCMQVAGIEDPQAYVAALATGGAAWQALVEAVVVQETWFFRDAAGLDAIVAEVRARRAVPGSPPVRVLSCPCSTGEEPYSVAMALLDAGVPEEAVAIHAVDVSPAAIASATRGVFRARSFRDATPRDRSHHLHVAPGASTWRVSDRIRALVSFGTGNLVTGEGLRDASPFDIVLCRNLLIYLDAGGRSRAIAMLARLLAPGGLLVVGCAEPAIVRTHGFGSTGAAAAFAFRAGTVTTTPVGASRASRPTRPARAPHVPTRVRLVRREPAPAVASATAPLARAEALGDLGRIDEAIRLCREHVGQQRDSVEGHFLLGVLQDAAGRHDLAVHAFRRALYLDPAHDGARAHLALKLEAGGAAGAAARLRTRTGRPVDTTGAPR
jgi:chemotaxis protein methyltransferase WspC